MKTLYLLRHAKAESGAIEAGDRDRVLAPRGHEACAAIGAYMKSKSYTADAIICSSAARTRETLALVASAAGLLAAPRYEDALYLATAEEVLQAVGQETPSASCVLVVGHNPGMHHLALMMSTPRRTKLRQSLELKYPTCSLTVLTFDSQSWNAIEPGQGELVDFITPDDL